MTHVTAQDWAKNRQKIVSLYTDNLEDYDPKQDSGEGIQQSIADTVSFFEGASVAPEASWEDSAKLFIVYEGRHAGKGYYGCGDVAHIILSTFGVNIAKFSNRDDDDIDGIISNDEAKNKWLVSQNISLLINGAVNEGKKTGRKYWTPGSEFVKPEVGDIVIIGDAAGGGGAHALIVTNADFETDEYVSIDGGQVDAGGQCIKRRYRKLDKRSKCYWLANNLTGPDGAGLGARGILGHISTSALVYDVGVNCRRIKSLRSRAHLFSQFDEESRLPDHRHQRNDVFRRKIF